MTFEHPTPNIEKEPHFLTLDEIVGKMNSLIDTRTGRCDKEPRIKRREDGLVTLVEYEIRNDDGNTSLLTFNAPGPRSHDTEIVISHFRGDPDDGDFLGGGGTLARYDEQTGIWTAVSMDDTKLRQAAAQAGALKTASRIQDVESRPKTDIPTDDTL